jgi:hypothetical protein
MSPRRFIRPECLGLRRRPLTRTLPYPWPFPFSVVDGRLVQNLPPQEPQEEESGAPQGRKGAKNPRKSRLRVRIRILG